ncbi:hypothetical protein CAEBREN_18222 [Caenorhabditis brenneri]|uniref:F-box domain-containing protein n=1 Tax=Caenorhabditis brenneri TaxID=135651 RepID=G0MQG9_CAEBE|nr:hypothetical protein CAEBREN_18222 [Caenorhabditis brenneri]
MKITHAPIPTLPSHQLNDVLKKMNIIDLINYASASPKCENDVKSMMPRRKLKLEIHRKRFYLRLCHERFTYKDVSIYVHNKQTFKKTDKKINIKGCPVVMKQDGRYLHFYFKNEVNGFIFILDYISDLFWSPPINLFMEAEDTKIGWLEITNWIKNKRNSEVESVKYEALDKFEKEDLVYMRNNIRASTVSNSESSDLFTTDLSLFIHHFPQPQK